MPPDGVDGGGSNPRIEHTCVGNSNAVHGQSLESSADMIRDQTLPDGIEKAGLLGVTLWKKHEIEILIGREPDPCSLVPGERGHHPSAKAPPGHLFRAHVDPFHLPGV